ncbi:L,D-transpeptidase catalytic domain protein [Mycobacterium ulcerans str. Harvey]|uniref:L,D-transpeptidase catalytic domain protein n=1 Tax=Mycobacterium ulcerans str. Harvey TaxID=1299332 RepID=A0ABP3APS6_MYCUL|nr:L,D-transpeptidase catalytic domain protein [Mycobacterium ulcerans str. Harvey]
MRRVGRDQGKRDVSHGCINLSPTNAKWFFDNFGSGDPIVVKNSVGPTTRTTARKTGRSSGAGAGARLRAQYRP